ncbi:MAG: AAA family ATPase [Planctomycetaceae bacterium]
MTVKRFGLSQSPFVNSGTDRAYIALPEWEHVLGALIRGVSDGQGISVLTGASGSGKTMICRELSARLSGQFLTVHLQSAGYTSRRALLQAMLFELGLACTGVTEQDARLQLFDTIQKAAPDRQGLVLIVDEADRVNVRLLEEFRALTNQTSGGLPLVRLVLCGNLPLEETLTSPECDAINQRIVCHETLAPLTCEESARYLDRRIMRAGGDGWEHLFESSAMEHVCRVADGSPRSLDLLADRSLHVADRRRCTRVTLEAVQEALTQLRDLPIRWNEPSTSTAEATDWNDDEYVDNDVMSHVENRHDASEEDCFSDDIPESTTFEFGCDLPEMRSTEDLDGRDESVTHFVGFDVAATPHDGNAEAESEWDESKVVPEHEMTDEAISETFVLEFGAETSPTAALTHTTSDSTPEVKPLASLSSTEEAPETMTAYDSAKVSPEPVVNASGWVEIDVDDPVAMLDRGQPVARTTFQQTSSRGEASTPISHKPTQIAVHEECDHLSIPNSSADTDAEHTNRPTLSLMSCASDHSETDNDVDNVLCDSGLDHTELSETESEILEEIFVLRAELRERLTTSAATTADDTEFGIIDTKQTDTDGNTSQNESLTIDDGSANELPIDGEGSESVPSADASRSWTDVWSGPEAVTEWDVIQPDPVTPRSQSRPRDQQLAPSTTVPTQPNDPSSSASESNLPTMGASVEKIEWSGVIHAGSESERRFRIDAAEPRPYAQLFSRLRRRRAEVADSRRDESQR